MRDELYKLMTNRENRPSRMRYSVMDPLRAAERPPPDERNPDSVVGVLDQPLASSFWLDQISHPRLMALLVCPRVAGFMRPLQTHPEIKAIYSVTTCVQGELLSPNVDFHNAKIRNKPPCVQCLAPPPGAKCMHSTDLVSKHCECHDPWLNSSLRVA